MNLTIAGEIKKSRNLRGCRKILFSFSLMLFLSGNQFAVEIESPSSRENQSSIKNRFAHKNGFIQYKSEYTLYMYPPFYTLTEKNKYIANVYSSILLDQLQLNRIIFIKDPAPEIISYPENMPQEDPRENFLTGPLPSPEQFDFNTRMIYRFPSNIDKPEKILTDPGLSRFFLPEDLYLVSSIDQIERQTESQNYIIRVWIFRNGKTIYNGEISTSEAEISRKVIDFARAISTKITGARTGSLRIKSDIDRASVYINDHYMGYTPLFIENAIAGENSVTIRKEGYNIWEKKIEVVVDRTTELSAVIEKIKSESSIALESSPDKCDVFLDVEYKGQTPLVIENVTPGTHRVHVQKNGFVDFFKTIQVEAGHQDYKISARLAKGNSNEYYDINRRIIGPLNYDQLFKSSALITAVTGLAGLFSQVQKENLQNNLNQYRNTSATAANQALVNKQLNEIKIYTALETGFYIGSGVFFAASIYLFIKYVGAQDMPIAGITNNPGNSNRVFLNINPHSNAFQFVFQHGL